jgi:hypothetical protein
MQTVFIDSTIQYISKYGKQDQQGKAAFNERTPHDPATRTSGHKPRRTSNETRTGHKSEHGLR